MSYDKKIEIIQDTKPVWVAWTNTDLTEGRGESYPLCVAESFETAIRLGRKGGPMGTDCQVSETLAVKVNNRWLIPGRINSETADDRRRREHREAKERAIENARAAGVSEEDIEAILR